MPAGQKRGAGRLGGELALEGERHPVGILAVELIPLAVGERVEVVELRERGINEGLEALALGQTGGRVVQGHDLKVGGEVGQERGDACIIRNDREREEVPARLEGEGENGWSVTSKRSGGRVYPVTCPFGTRYGFFHAVALRVKRQHSNEEPSCQDRPLRWFTGLSGSHSY